MGYALARCASQAFDWLLSVVCDLDSWSVMSALEKAVPRALLCCVPPTDEANADGATLGSVFSALGELLLRRSEDGGGGWRQLRSSTLKPYAADLILGGPVGATHTARCHTLFLLFFSMKVSASGGLEARACARIRAIARRAFPSASRFFSEGEGGA